MKKIKVTQLKKNNIVTMVCIALFLVLIVYATYAAITNTLLINNTNASVNIGSRPIFTVTTSKNEIDTNITLQSYNGNSELGALVDGFDLTVSLSTAYNDNQTTECTYDIVFNWADDSDHYIKTEGTDKEYVLFGDRLDVYDADSLNNYYNISDEDSIQLPDYNSSDLPLKIKEQESITSTGTSITSYTYYYSLIFYTNYNSSIDQSYHLDKNYKGQITVENVNCKKTESTISGENTSNYLTNIIESKSTEIPTVDDLPSFPADFSGVADMGKYGIRYVGANPDNYIYFNCDDYANPSADTCELWRIVGINTFALDGLTSPSVKIVRNDITGQNFIKNFTGEGLESPTSKYIVDVPIGHVDDADLETFYSNLSSSYLYSRYMYSITNSYLKENSGNFYGTTHTYQLVDLIDYVLASGTSNDYSGSYCINYDYTNWTASGGCADNNWLTYINSSSSNIGNRSEYQILSAGDEFEAGPVSEDNPKDYYIMFEDEGLRANGVYYYKYIPVINKYDSTYDACGHNFHYIDINGGYNVMSRNSLNDCTNSYHLNFRDAFYLNPYVKIAGGDGTSSNPYILDSSIESLFE